MIQWAAGLLLVAITWGVLQGMTMIRLPDPMFSFSCQMASESGVRRHRWFPVYHRIIVVFLCATFLTIRAWPVTRLIISAGGLAMAWSVFEMAYSYARYKTPVADQENVLGAGWYIRGAGNVLALHIGRLAVGAALIAWRIV